jgi:hypothetical protein
MVTLVPALLPAHRPPAFVPGIRYPLSSA